MNSQHLRHRGFDRVRHSPKLMAWLAAQATRLAGLAGSESVTYDNTTNTLTVSSNPYTEGSSIQLATDGTLPAELSDTETYFVGNVSGDDFQLFTSYTEALEADSPIAFTDDGSGTMTTVNAVDERQVFNLMKGNQLTSRQVEVLTTPFL